MIYGLRSLRWWFRRVVAGLAGLWLWHCLAADEGPNWIAAIAGVGALIAFYYLASRVIREIDDRV